MNADKPMTQYCRYCFYAVNYEDTLICMAKAPCGNNGAGHQYPLEKAKRVNHCRSFEFNPLDLLSDNPDGSFREYKPRGPLVTKAERMKREGQINMLEQEELGWEGDKEADDAK
jgi:hypothetical protein